MAVFNINALLLQKGTKIAGIQVSVKKGEQHDFSAQVTQIPLESGETLSDHMIIAPEKVIVNFECVNTDLTPPATTFARFRKMLHDREIIELVTEHRTYPAMVLTGFSASHTTPFKGAFTGTLTFEEVNEVELTTIGRASSKVNRSKAGASGAVQAKERGQVNELNKADEENSTLLGNLAGMLGGL